MFKLQQIIRANMGELAKNITSEQGKTLIDAEGDVLRGLRKLIFFIHKSLVKRNKIFRGCRTYVQHNKSANG